MAKVIQINASLSTTDGGSISPGAIVLFSVGFPAGKINYVAGFKVYRNMNALTNNAHTVNNITGWKSSMQFSPSEAEFDALTPLIIYEKVRSALGVIYGDANVVIIDLPTSGT